MLSWLRFLHKFPAGVSTKYVLGMLAGVLILPEEPQFHIRSKLPFQQECQAIHKLGVSNHSSSFVCL